MSGAKGGSTSSTVTIPEYIEEAARRNLTKAEKISQLGYVPYYGPDVAAFTPMQEAAFQNVSDTASAFGLSAPATQADIMGGMQRPTEYAGGLKGYSSAPMYQASLDRLAAERPSQKSYMDSFFINPYTGEYASPLTDYSQFNTLSDEAALDRANRLAIAQAGAGGGGIGGGVNDPAIMYNPTYTTYGGHQDIAHDAIDTAFSDYGQNIQTLGATSNPAYNAEVAAAYAGMPVTYTTKDDLGAVPVTKLASEITTSDFDAASAADQGALYAASMGAAGIKNIGGGYNQNDPTTGLLGGVKDVFGNVVETVADIPFLGLLSTVADAFDKPDSTYTIGTSNNNSKKNDDWANLSNADFSGYDDWSYY
tara:strand:+ start:737 stop:1831 length:1095 start_codon:yes stop_codon:yes gene_type:complete